jgi:hypothetical protein
VNATLADDARVAHIGAAVLAGSSADFAKLVAHETKKWGKVVVAANLKANRAWTRRSAANRHGVTAITSRTAATRRPTIDRAR